MISMSELGLIHKDDDAPGAAMTLCSAAMFGGALKAQACGSHPRGRFGKDSVPRYLVHDGRSRTRSTTLATIMRQKSRHGRPIRPYAYMNTPISKAHACLCNLLDPCHEFGLLSTFFRVVVIERGINLESCTRPADDTFQSALMSSTSLR